MPVPTFRCRSRALRTTSMLLAGLLATAVAPAVSAGYTVLDTFVAQLTTKPLIRTVAVDSQGRLLVGGVFRLPDGNPGNGLARLNVDGSVDTTFQGVCSARSRRAAISCSVNAIAVADNGDIFVVGLETEQRGVISYSFLTKLSPDGALVPEWSPIFPIGQTNLGYADRLEIRGNTLVVLGQVGFDQGNAVAALQASTQGTGAALPFVAKLSPGMYPRGASSDALGNVYVHFASGNVNDPLQLARFNAPAGTIDAGFAPFKSIPTAVAGELPLVVPDANAILVRGDTGLVHAIDPSGTTLPGWPAFEIEPIAAVPGGVLARGGGFSGTVSVQRVAIAAPSSPETVASFPAIGNQVLDLAPRGTGVVVAIRSGDQFIMQQPNALRVYDSSGALDPRFSDSVRSVTGGAPLRVGNDMYLSGSFERINGTNRPFFARFRNGVPDASWQPHVPGYARQFIASGNRLVASGTFYDVNGSGLSASIVGFDAGASGSAQIWQEDPFSFGFQVEAAVGDGNGGASFFGPFDVQLCATPARSFGVHVLSPSPCVVDSGFAVSAQYSLVVAGNDGWLYGVRSPFSGPSELRRFSAATGAEQAGWGATLARLPVALAVAPDGVFVALVPDPTNPDSLPVLQRALRINGAIETAWTPPIRARITQLESQAGVLFVGGVTLGDTAHYKVWRLNPLTGAPDPQWQLDADTEGAAFAALDSSSVVLSGGFTQVNGATRAGLAAYGSETPLFADSFE